MYFHRTEKRPEGISKVDGVVSLGHSNTFFFKFSECNFSGSIWSIPIQGHSKHTHVHTHMHVHTRHTTPLQKPWRIYPFTACFPKGTAYTFMSPILYSVPNSAFSSVFPKSPWHPLNNLSPLIRILFPPTSQLPWSHSVQPPPGPSHCVPHWGKCRPVISPWNSN